MSDSISNPADTSGGTTPTSSPLPRVARASAPFTHAWQIDVAGLAACAVLSASAYFLVVAPALASRDAQAAGRVALAEARQQAAGLASSARLVQAQLADAQATLARVEIPLQPATAVNARLAALADLALQCGLDVQYSKTGALTPAASQRFARLPIQLAGTGRYRACESFLRRLRTEFPDTGMKTFDLSAAPADENASVSFNFDLVWFVQPATK